MADAGHNSVTVEGKHIRSIVERVERLHEERKQLGDDIRDVFAEARGNGFDVPTLKAIVKKRADRRKHGDAKVDEQNSLVEIYEAAMGAD